MLNLIKSRNTVFLLSFQSYVLESKDSGSNKSSHMYLLPSGPLLHLSTNSGHFNIKKGKNFQGSYDRIVKIIISNIFFLFRVKKPLRVHLIIKVCLCEGFSMYQCTSRISYKKKVQKLKTDMKKDFKLNEVLTLVRTQRVSGNQTYFLSG